LINIIKAFKTVKNEIFGAKLWIVGLGDEKDRLEKLVKDLGLDDVIFWDMFQKKRNLNY